MKANRIGIYVHVPFCVRKCSYCDFCSFPIGDTDWRGDYLDRLICEIESYGGQGICADTLFIGGGTPSLLSCDEFGRLVDTLRETFSFSANTEFTVEVNPGTLTDEKLRSYVSRGVNRLSFGLQSIHENELKILGRIHTFDDFLSAFALARKHGIENINVDIMYGIPEQTAASFSETVEHVISLCPEHISAYGLILEENTPFWGIRDKLPLPTEDEECDMYYAAAKALSERGYNHYEISNYSKPGYECRHNLKYWRKQEYIGLGLSAHSYFCGKRFCNASDFTEYRSGGQVSYEERTRESDVFEYAMLRLRLTEGFSLDEYRERFGIDFCETRKDIIERLCEGGFATVKNGRICLTERGFYVSNAILSELL